MLIGTLCFSEDSFPSFMFLRTLFKGGQGERHPHDRLGGSRKKWGQACSRYFDRMGIQLTAMLDQPHNTFLCVIFRLLEHFVSAENSAPYCPLLIYALQRSPQWHWIFWTPRLDCEPLIETGQLTAFRWYSKRTQQIRSFRFKIIWSWFTKSWTYCNCSWEPAFIQGQ